MNSGSVSAEDNLGIGGYERIMGQNGQGQYWAPDLPRAISVLLAHYDPAYHRSMFRNYQGAATAVVVPVADGSREGFLALARSLAA